MPKKDLLKRIIMEINYKEECLKMWDWLVRNPDKEKVDYFYAHPEKEIPSYLCYACQYDKEQSDTECAYCPITWNPLNKKEHDFCGSENSPYYKWRNSKYDTDKRYWALKIYHVIKNTWKEN
jgi:hypothetical protein